MTQLNSYVDMCRHSVLENSANTQAKQKDDIFISTESLGQNNESESLIDYKEQRLPPPIKGDAKKNRLQAG